jgi:hypothetical protein
MELTEGKTIMTDPLGDPGAAREGAEGNVRRDQWGRYLLPLPTVSSPGVPFEALPGEPVIVSWTRATTLAKTLDDTYSLSAWQAAMAVQGIARTPSLYLAAATTDYGQDKDAFNKIVADAQHAAGANERRDLGSATHKLFEINDRDGESAADAVCPPMFRRELDAYRQLLQRHGIAYLPDMIERVGIATAYDQDLNARNPRGGVAGTLDRAGSVHGGRPGIIDIKTGASLRYMDLYVAIQTALYQAFELLVDFERGVYVDPPELDDTLAYVLHTPAGQPEAFRLRPVDIRAGRIAAARAVEIRRMRKVGLIGAPLPAWNPAVEESRALVSQALSVPPEEDLDVFGDAEEAPPDPGPLPAPGDGIARQGTARRPSGRARKRKRCTGCNELTDPTTLSSTGRCPACATESAPAAVEPVRMYGPCSEARHGCDRMVTGGPGPLTCPDCAADQCPKCHERPGVGAAGTLCSGCGLDAALTPGPSAPGPELSAHQRWGARIDQATQRADLSAIWRDASIAREWSPELQRYAEAHQERGYVPLT